MDRPLPLALVTLLLGWGAPAWSDVVVLLNRTPRDVPVRVTADGRTGTLRLESGQSRPVFADESVLVEHAAAPVGGERLTLNEAYFFAPAADGSTVFRQIGLAGPSVAKAPRGPWNGTEAATDLSLLLVVDEEEPTTAAVWSTRLKRRVAEVSKVLRAHAGVGLRIVGFERYRSDNRITDFSDALKQFERSVDPPPGVVAVGFSSQFEVSRGRRRLGGTRGPLRRHLLLREYSPKVTEAERVEALVHELGHYLGATHSPEADSVMRPVLGDARTRLKSFEVKFDAVNTLAIAMVGEEVRRRGVRSVTSLSPGTRLRLGRIYATLGQALPDDPAAQSLSRRVVGPVVTARLRGATQAIGPARFTLALTAEAIENAKRAGDAKLSGDRWTSRLVRVAAAAAGPETDEGARRTLLVALGFALNDTDALVLHPRTRKLAERVDPPASRRKRRAAIGRPTTRGRADTTKHFFVSAALTAASTSAEAEAWGLAKEAIDAMGKSGYSFADLAANRAGIRFAERVLAGAAPTAWLAERFSVNDFTPDLAGLPEGLSASEVVDRYGGVGDPRFEALRKEIDARIDRLPPYALDRLLLSR